MKKATRVFVTQPKIAEVVVVAPDQLLIHGRAVGTTSLVHWFEEKTKAREQWKLRRAGPVLYFFFLAAVAFRIIAAHFVASASDSNPKTAEYFLPTTWATRKSMLIPAPAMACAVA
jgi:hypothetical protein